MVLHSRGCGRVARRRFQRRGSRRAACSGNPIFFILFLSVSRPSPWIRRGWCHFWYRMSRNGVIRVPSRRLSAAGLLQSRDSMALIVRDRRPVSFGYQPEHMGGVIRVPTSSYWRPFPLENKEFRSFRECSSYSCLLSTDTAHGWCHSGTGRWKWCLLGTVVA